MHPQDIFKPPCPCGKPSKAKGLCSACYARTPEQREKRKVYALAHKADHAAVSRKYYAGHTAEHTSRVQAYEATHKEKQAARRKAWVAANREQFDEKARAWHQTPKRKEYERRYLVEHAPQIRAKTAQRYAEADKEQLRAYARERYAISPEASLEHNFRRRVRLTQPTSERISWDALYERDGGICQICHRPVERSKMSPDHIIPLAEGGTHTFLNVQLSHRSCNYKRAHRGAAQERML